MIRHITNLWHRLRGKPSWMWGGPLEPWEVEILRQCKAEWGR